MLDVSVEFIAPPPRRSPCPRRRYRKNCRTTSACRPKVFQRFSAGAHRALPFIGSVAIVRRPQRRMPWQRTSDWSDSAPWARRSRSTSPRRGSRSRSSTARPPGSPRLRRRGRPARRPDHRRATASSRWWPRSAAPRAIILMVPAGAPVDQMIAALTPLLGPDDMIIDAGNANFHDTRRRAAEAEAAGRALPRDRRLRRRGGRAPRTVDHGRRSAGGLGPRRPDPRGDRSEVRRRTLRHLDGHRRRRPLRQDRAQRHRVCRHADDRRDLRDPARRPRPAARGDRRRLRPLERGAAQVLPRRDHRHRLPRRPTRSPAGRWSM